MTGVRALLSTFVLASLLAGCGKSPEDRLAEAQKALDGGDPAAAITAVDQALADAAISGDKALAWRFESLRLDAQARAGKGADVAAGLARLSQTYAAQVTAALYRSLADKTRAAGDNSGAIDILAAGDKAFPAEHDSFQKAIDELKNTGLDPAEVEKLKALGYL